MRTQSIFATLCLLGAMTASTRADFVYEGMSYPSGNQLVQQSGGEGFSGGWYAGGFNASTNNFSVDATTLSYGNLQVSGGAVSTIAGSNINGVARNLPTTLLTPGTHYLSFLIDRNSTAGDFGGFGGLYLDGSLRDVFIGKPGTNNFWSIENRGGGVTASSGVAANVNETALLVLKMQLSGTANEVDIFNLYVNPTIGNAEPTANATLRSLDVGTIGSIVLYNAGAYTFDEIRIGDSFEAVTAITAVPEPGTFVLLGSAIGALVLRNARRRLIARS